MSGKCGNCGEHCLDCKCPIILERKWISKEEAKKLFPDIYEKDIYLNGSIVCKYCEKEPIDCNCLNVKDA